LTHILEDAELAGMEDELERVLQMPSEVKPVALRRDREAFLPILRPVLRSSELADFIAWYNSSRAPSITSPELRRAIVHHLHHLQQKPDQLLP